MAASIIVTKGKIIENSAVVLMARVIDIAGDPMQIADITSLVIKVFDSEGTQVSTATLTVADVISDTLVTGDPRWTADEIGYNFAHAMAGSNWPEAGKYFVELKVTPVTGFAFYVLWELQAVNIFSE